MEEASPTTVFTAHPELLALGIIVAGVILARLTSMGAGFALNRLDAHAARVATTNASVLTPQLIRVVRGIVFWLVLTLAIALALQALGAGGLPAMLDVGMGFVPQVLIGVLIVVIGHLLGLIASSLLSGVDDGALSTSPVPRLVHAMIVVVALVIGLQQVGIDISFVTRLILILVGVIGAGLAIAFGLGSRQHVANLMASGELTSFRVGERIRIEDIEGTVIEVHSTGVSISTEDGVANVPASRFAESVVIRIPDHRPDE